MARTNSRTAFPLRDVVNTFQKAFTDAPAKVKVLDIYIGAALLTIVLQFAYASLVGTFPFNSFLAGVFCCAGSAVLTLCLRLQISSGQLDMPVDRAFVEYALAMVVLFLACFCYLG